jgi:hypothetical protein
MPKKKPRKKPGKKNSGKTKRVSRRKMSRRGKKPASRARLAPTKIPGGGASAQIHQGTGGAPVNPSEIVPKTTGGASN